MIPTLLPAKRGLLLFFFTSRAQTCCLLFFLLTGLSPVFATTLYVKENGTGTGTNSWDNASSDLQAIINAASSGDEVWVAGGTYQPASGTSFQLKEGVKIYGGFAGNETNRSDRNLTLLKNKTTLLGNGASVIRNENLQLTSASVLDGFNIIGGSVSAGIVNVYSSPMLVNLIISGNSEGGVMNENSSPTLMRCTITNNSSTTYPGGITNLSSSPIVTNCVIARNESASSINVGNLSSSPVFTNCTISGGLVYNAINSTVTIRNSIIFGNNSGIINEQNSTSITQHNLVQNSTDWNNHNFGGSTNPLFVDMAAGDFRLQACSPAINGGSNAYYSSEQSPDLSAVTTDIEGNARIYNQAAVDMGAYEYQNEPPSGTAGVWYVKEGGTGTGRSWACAAGSLQLAINSAASGEQVWVAGGTYYPDVDQNSQGSFKMKEGVKIYGGFTGTESNFSDRVVTISGNKSILATPGGSRSYTLSNDNNGLTTAAVLDGFTVNPAVGGIMNSNSSPLFVNVEIKPGFSSPSNGTAISNTNSSPVFFNCLIVRINGVGMYNSGSSPVLLNCTIADVVSAMNNVSHSSPVIANSIIIGINQNTVNEIGSDPLIQHSLVRGVTNSENVNNNFQGDVDPFFCKCFRRGLQPSSM